MGEILLLLVLAAAIGGLLLGLWTQPDAGPSTHWTWALAALAGQGVFATSLHGTPAQQVFAPVVGAIYPMLLLAGACAFAERPPARGWIPLAAAIGVLRALLVAADLPVVEQAVALVTEPVWVLGAAWVVTRTPDNGPRSPAERVLPFAMVAVAGLEAWTAATGTAGSRLPSEQLTAWVLIGPVAAALQLSAASHRDRRAWRAVNDDLERRVAERTGDLARSLESLRRSEERYRIVSELSSDFSFSLGVAHDRVVDKEWISGAWREITGYTEADFPTLRLSDLVHADDRERLRALVAGSLANKRPEQVRMVRRNGELRWIELRFSLVVRDGEVIRLVGAATDVTEQREVEEQRRRLETQLREFQRLQSLSVLAGGIAHDFNNLLHVILGNSALAADDAPAGSVLARRLDRVSAAAQKASELTDQMLTYAGRREAELVPVDLAALIEGMGTLLRSGLRSQVTLEIEASGPLPPVDGDATQLRQVVLDLVANAAEACERGGVVSVRAGCTRFDADALAGAHGGSDLQPGPFVTLEVRDDGPGIPAELQERIFEPFFTTRFSGRGLGLAAVLGAVHAHGGGILVESGRGSGARIRVLLPVSGGRGAVTAGAAGDAAAGGRILVIDDEPAALELAAEFLGRAGFEVETACGGREGIEQFRLQGDRIDLVLLDLAMPEVGGEEAFASIRRKRPDVPVVLMSGYSEQLARERFDLPGATRFLRKPYEPEDLVSAVRAALA